MSLLNSFASLVVSDPFPRALKDREQARADLATAKARAADGRAYNDARAKEVEARPRLANHRGSHDWSPAQDAGEVGVLQANDAVAVADVDVDTHCPRANSIRARLRQTPKRLANAHKDPTIAAIAGHVDALRELGVDPGDLANAAAQKALAVEFDRIAADFKALREERSREGLPDAYLFTVERAVDCRPLRNLGVESGTVLDGLRQAAYAEALTVEVPDAVCEFIGTKPAPPPWTATGRGYEINQRRTHWEERQQQEDQRAEDRRLGLRY